MKQEKSITVGQAITLIWQPGPPSTRVTQTAKVKAIVGEWITVEAPSFRRFPGNGEMQVRTDGTIPDWGTGARWETKS